MKDENDLVSAGEFGDKVSAFIDSEIGKYLIACKARDEAEAAEALLSLDPFKYSSLGELQSKIAELQENMVLARKIHGYLADAIINGKQADQLLMTKEDN